MKPLSRLLATIRALFRRDAVAGEIHDELAFHFEARVAQYEREGLSPEDARRKARRRVGNIAVHQDRGYDIRGGGVLETIVQDVRYGVRLLVRQPSFSWLAIATLALGIGASTAVVSVIDAAILRPLPYPNPEQLVEILIETNVGGGQRASLDPSEADRLLWVNANRTFAQIATIRYHDMTGLVDDTEPERLKWSDISDGYLELHGVAPVVGRSLTPDDLRPGAPPVLLISHSYWQRRFGGQDDAVGRLLRYDGQAATIVGVLPDTFYPERTIWRPIRLRPGFESRRGMGGSVYGRLRPGVSTEAAAEELTHLTIAADAQGPDDDRPRVLVASLLEETNPSAMSTSQILAGAVLSVLLIACINVAGLQLARGATRREEFAIRASIGAGTFRLVRQMLTESLVLAAAGGLTGVLVAWLSLDALVANLPMSLPDNSRATMNVQVLGYAAALTMATGLLFGLLPALRLSRAPLGPARSGAGRRADSTLPRRGGQVLVAAEVALAVILLAGAGLMLRSFNRAVTVDVGFDPARLLTIDVVPVAPERPAHYAYYSELLAALERLPGVAAAGATDTMPLTGGARMFFAMAPGDESVPLEPREILPGYLQAIGQPLLEGRDLDARDRSATTVTGVLINQRAARDLFPDGSALGRRVSVGGEMREVVGVVGDIRHDGPLSRTTAEVYTPFKTWGDEPTPELGLTVVVRPTERDPVTPDVLRDVARSIGPRVVVGRIRTGSDWFGERVTRPRQRTVLLSVLGGLGLVLALVGIFGMTAYSVARRTREIGVRMAFGARPDQVVGRVVRDAAWPIVLGTVAGLGGASVATGVIASFLFETEPTDPATFAAVAIVLATAGLIAAWIPARRAAQVDPVAALRAE